MSDSGESSGRTPPQRRQLRERKQRKLYLDEWSMGDDELEGARGFSVAEKLKSTKFAQNGMVREMTGAELTVAFLQQHGFNIPLLFRDATDLGLRMPNPNEFTVNDVRLCVGSRRILDVMDVNTQKNIQMTMKAWQQYYDNPHKNRLLNVISLEFSHTRLDNYIQSPSIVREIDWVDVVWPRRLKEAQREGTNLLGNMMYPKVQKYCLMSVKNCYTDFHIDFGGTSVWYHILKGSKVFWLIPPTERNLQLYEKWVLSGKQADIFFGDTVEKCARVYLTAGNTFFIPTGWIHAVYTPTDSLVFGGNFLHSFGIVKQLKTAQVEDTTKVPQKFRYPFFTEMLWYVLARYVYVLLGHSHLEGEDSQDEALVDLKPHVHLTHYELFGLKEIVMYLYDLPPHKKNVPELVLDPVALIKDVRTLVERHCKDKPELAITGLSVLSQMPEVEQSLFERYDRAKVKQEIKQEIAAKEAEIIREQQQLDAAAAAAVRVNENSGLNVKTDSSNINLTNGFIGNIKKEPIENGTTNSLRNNSTATFVLPMDNIKYRPPKKMHLANAVAAAAAINNTVSVIASNCSSYNSMVQTGLPSTNQQLNHIAQQNSNNTAIVNNKIYNHTNINQGCSLYNNINNVSANSAQTANINNNNNILSTINVNNNSGSEHCHSPPNESSKMSTSVTGTGQPRRRRTRCKICAACQRSDCGECGFCLDMVKFGGPGRAKQTCLMRQCLAPMLPVTAQCAFCHLDGWGQTPVSPQTKQLAQLEGPSSLMECSVCYEITHSECAISAASASLPSSERVKDFSGDTTKGIVNVDLPNSWECPSCCRSGKNNDYKPRHFRARLKSSEVRRISVSNNGGGGCSNISPENMLIDGNSIAATGLHHINEFVFSSESEMESVSINNHNNNNSISHNTVNGGTTGNISGHGNWKQMALKRHYTSDIKTERYSSDTPSPGVSISSSAISVGGTEKGKRRKSDDGLSMCSSIQDSMDNNITNLEIGGNSGGIGCGSGSMSGVTSGIGFAVSVTTPTSSNGRKKSSIRSQLAQHMLNTSSRFLKKPSYVVRPSGHGGHGHGHCGHGNHTNNHMHNHSSVNLALDPTLLKIIFRYLPQETLVGCCLVCKVWSNVAVDPDLWKTMNCAEMKLTASLLTAIVRRQPEHLLLDWTQIAKRQLSWVITRLPALKNLSLQNCPIQAVLALHTCLCPPLKILDLSFVRGLNDAAIREILLPPKDSRPGLTDSKTRLKDLKIFKVAGTDISDVALRYITQSLTHLVHLDVSSCQRVTDAGVAQIGTSATAIANLVELNLSACRLVSELSLDHLARCEKLVWLDLRHVPQVSTQSVIKFAAKSKHDLCVKDVKLVEKRRSSLHYNTNNHNSVAVHSASMSSTVTKSPTTNGTEGPTAITTGSNSSSCGFAMMSTHSVGSMMCSGASNKWNGA